MTEMSLLRKEVIYINNIIRVFDNKGKTWDRYTVVIADGDDVAVYGMSINADQPNGFNQFSGSVAELPAVAEALTGKTTDLGAEVKLLDLPLAVRLAIGNRLKDNQ